MCICIQRVRFYGVLLFFVFHLTIPSLGVVFSILRVSNNTNDLEEFMHLKNYITSNYK